MNSARLTMIMLEGVVASPMPERRMAKAMTKRGKLVTMMRMPGATDRTVSRPKVRMIQDATEPSTGVFRISLGKPCAPAIPDIATMAAMNATVRIMCESLDDEGPEDHIGYAPFGAKVNPFL